ncbi:hypothetical protein [Saccharolobus caldissimus]|uniref:Uncharacterized protein n=1 Tax=Saccharolobus caldissimus TaxID=1702097 RepID=A0AAQ4CQG8_9CREN|nr:hypothetical protein [Saccharolobus caldissimus]BDB98049.1 hypothetical protein SACC_10660 [Saccharolobus caldissimus]
MFRGIFRIWIYQTLNEISKGKKSVEELRRTLPIYGTVFDFLISFLLTSGLAKRSIENNIEYLEITDLGKSYLAGMLAWHGFWGHRRWW